MLGTILSLLFTVGAIEALNLEEVDPNTLSCDPHGEIFLLLPHFEDCTKYFMCTHGKEVEFNCSANLYFDFVLQTCNYPRDTKCILRKSPDNDIEEGSGEDEFKWLTDNAQNDGSARLTGDNVANTVRPLNIEKPERSPIFGIILNCLRADDAARRVSYKTDCQRYWRCMNGVLQIAYCTDGLFFNERLQQCDFEANVKCTDEQEDEFKNEFIVYK